MRCDQSAKRKHLSLLSGQTYGSAGAIRRIFRVRMAAGFFSVPGMIFSAARFRSVADSVWTARVAALILATVFLWAGAAKLQHKDDFFNAIGHYRLLSPNAAYRLVQVLPWVEITLGASLLVPVRFLRRLGAVALFVLLLVFTAGLISLWVHGKDANCGCFGGTSHVHPAWPVLRNVALMLCAIAVIRRGASQRPVSW